MYAPEVSAADPSGRPPPAPAHASGACPRRLRAALRTARVQLRNSPLSGVSLDKDRFRPCVLIPTFENAKTVRGVVEAARAHVHDVVVVDDGSGPEAREVVAALERE